MSEKKKMSHKLKGLPDWNAVDWNLWDFATIFHKGNNFCNFLFAFPHTKPLLKDGLL